MRFIVNKKIYDTDKAELLCTFYKHCTVKTLLGATYPVRKTNLYKTAKGAYFLTSSINNAGYNYSIEVIDEEEAKNYLMHNGYNKYTELFGELEEA